MVSSMRAYSKPLPLFQLRELNMHELQMKKIIMLHPLHPTHNRNFREKKKIASFEREKNVKFFLREWSYFANLLRCSNKLSCFNVNTNRRICFVLSKLRNSILTQSRRRKTGRTFNLSAKHQIIYFESRPHKKFRLQIQKNKLRQHKKYACHTIIDNTGVTVYSAPCMPIIVTW